MHLTNIYSYIQILSISLKVIFIGMTSFMLETKAYWEPHAYWVLVREPERNRPQGRPRSRSKHTVKIDVREEG
jgi:hypothetical protein